jgi:hypothetical protein
MALILIDGFDYFSEGQSVAMGWTMGNFLQVSWSSSYARYGGVGIRITDSGSPSYILHRNMGVNKSTIYLGIAIYKYGTGTPYFHNDGAFVLFEDESNIDQVKLYVNNSWGIDVYRGDNTLLGSTADDLIANRRWFYLEAKVTISATVGVVELRINGNQVLNLTSQDTKNGSDYIRSFGLTAIHSDNETNFDDIYVDDAQFHGDCRVKTFVPDSDGNSTDFTRSTGSNDYECVDELPANEDTDYIVSDTLNHKSIFGITTGALGTVKGIQLSNRVRIDEVGTKKITPIVRSNSTDYTGTETELITADYLFESEIWETDPDDSNPWDQTKLEAAEFGLEITT